MHIGRLDHVSFAVRDLERSLWFYRDVLGLAPAPRPEMGVPGAWLRVGDAQLHLIEVPAGFDRGAPPGALSPAASHAALGIDDYGAVRDRLRAHDIDVLEAESFGQMWVRDPDGWVIELTAVRR